MTSELNAALQAIGRVRALVHRHYTGSPGYENTPESVREIDAIRDLYSDGFADELLAALEGAPEPTQKSVARVTTVGPESSCALGICLSGCSHLMWYCDNCSCEGGWGGSRTFLEELADEHVCPPEPVDHSELISEAREACEQLYFKGTYQQALMSRLADALEGKNQ